MTSDVLGWPQLGESPSGPLRNTLATAVVAVATGCPRSRAVDATGGATSGHAAPGVGEERHKRIRYTRSARRARAANPARRRVRLNGLEPRRRLLSSRGGNWRVDGNRGGGAGCTGQSGRRSAPSRTRRRRAIMRAASAEPAAGRRSVISARSAVRGAPCAGRTSGAAAACRTRPCADRSR